VKPASSQRLRFALAIALTVAGAACTAPPLTSMSRLLPGQPRPRELTAFNDGQSVILARKQELIVALDANPTTGYGWSVNMSVAGVLDAVGGPVHTQRQGDPRLVGAGGVTTYRFRAVDATGKTRLVFTYRRPWETNLPPAKVVRYDVAVE
jgi:inhibitor of cysteine peptidase